MFQRKWGSLAIGLFLLYLVVGGNRGLWNLYKLHQEKQDYTEQISRLKSEINQYQVQAQAFQKNTTLIEKQAREELNLIKPSETVYKFSNSSHP